MKNAKRTFMGLVVTAMLCVFTTTFGSGFFGVSVYVENMFDKPKTTNATKETYTMQTFEPIDVYKDRQGYVALFVSNGAATDGLWHAFNKENGSWDVETFSTQSQMIPGDYYLQFKTTGVYIGGTGITGYWNYDL